MRISDYLTKQEFYSIRSNSSEPQIILFAATWCGFCKRFVEIVRNAESNYNGKVRLVNADSEGETLWDEYSIGVVPTIVVIKEGRVIFRQDGRPMAGLSKGDLERAISAASGQTYAK